MEGQIAGGGLGGGYVFTPAEFDAVIARWEALHAELVEDHRQVEVLMEVRGPGDEFASDGAANEANDSGSAFRNHHDRMVTAVRDYTDQLRASRAGYQNQDSFGASGFAGQL